MKQVSFAVEKVTDENTGQVLDCVVKTTREVDGTLALGDKETKEPWCSILDLDRLFEGCVKKWGPNWNLDKVLAAIESTEIE